MTGETILISRKISKSYGDVLALDSLEIEMKRGQILGLLGENGAGKSTAISIFSGDIKPDSGEVLYKGKDIKVCKKDYQMNLGYVPQELALFFDISVYENLKFWAGAYHVKSAEKESRIKEIADVFDITNVLKKKPSQLSGGYQRRLNIACSVLHNPEILFLDEPTVGIDVSIRKSILKTVRSFANEGMSILYTSHYIDELQEIADSVLMIKNGKKIAYLEKKDFAEKSLEEIYLSLV